MTEWRTIPSFPNYEVSERGAIRRRTASNRAPAGSERRLGRLFGYPTLQLTQDGQRQRKFVHQLVAEAFLPPQPTPEHEVAHNDGSRDNNDFRNLRWATRQENMLDKVKHGTHQTGEAHPNAKLSRVRISEALMRHEHGETLREIAQDFGVHVDTISRALRGNTWRSTSVASAEDFLRDAESGR